MLDADGATAIADIEKLEKAMDTLTKEHVCVCGYLSCALCTILYCSIL